MSYIAGHEHYPEHNNWKRGFVESAVSSYSATDGFCGDGHGYDKPNSLDVGFNISNKTFFNFYNVGSNGGCHGSSGFLPNLIRGFAGNSCCGTNSNIGWLGRATGTLLNFGLKIGLTSWLMNKWSGGSIYGTGLGGGGYQFYPTSWVGGGSSIFGSGFGGGYAGTGDMLINSTGMLPWSPVSYSGVGTNGNGTGGANNTGGATTNNNSQGTTPQNNNNQPVSPSNNDNGSGNGTVISANDFNNAIDDLASDGKTSKLYYGIAQNTNESMKGYLEKTVSKHGADVDAETQKRGIRRGVSTKHANELPKGESDATKTSEGYYKYITLTDGTSDNEYTYTFVSAKDGKLTYKLSKDFTDTTKDDKGDDKGWEGTGAEPEVVIRIKDGVIYLESAGTDYSASKKGAKLS